MARSVLLQPRWMADGPVRPGGNAIEDPPAGTVFPAVGPDVGSVVARVQAQAGDDDEDVGNRRGGGVDAHPATGSRRAPAHVVLRERVVLDYFGDRANAGAVEDVVDRARAVLLGGTARIGVPGGSVWQRL